MCLPRGSDRLVGASDLLHRGDEAHRRHLDAAPLLRHEHPEQPECAHRAEQLRRTALLLPRSRRDRLDLAFGEGRAEVREGSLVVGEVEDHRGICRSGSAGLFRQAQHPFAQMLRWISAEPPWIVSARDHSNSCCQDRSGSRPRPDGSARQRLGRGWPDRRSVALLWRRSACSPMRHVRSRAASPDRRRSRSR